VCGVDCHCAGWTPPKGWLKVRVKVLSEIVRPKPALSSILARQSASPQSYQSIRYTMPQNGVLQLNQTLEHSALISLRRLYLIQLNLATESQNSSTTC
jgi:hypothetical protein